MARAEQSGADLFATPQEIARGLFLVRGDMNRGERARAIEDRQLASSAPIGLDAIARATGNQRGRDDIAGDRPRRQRPLELEAARSRSVTTTHRALAPPLLHKPHDRRVIRRQRVQS
jgi:hypothetical protein